MRVVDCFAGPGGWSEGMVASPPCQAFSAAGKREGIGDLPKIHAAIEACRDGWRDDARAGPWADERSPLILEPLRWAWTIKPTWIACEQVPPALGVWRHMADVLRGWGYDARALRLLSADYGVPQTRLRAFLLAHRGGCRVPEPTHAEKPEPGLFATRRKWVSMAEALGWAPGEVARVRNYFDRDPKPHEGGGAASPTFDPNDRPARTATHRIAGWEVATGKNTADGTRPYQRGVGSPSPVVDSRADLWKVRQNNTARATERGMDEPAASLAADQIRKTVVVRGEPVPVRLRMDKQRNATEPAPTIKGGHSFGEMRFLRAGTNDHDVERAETEPAPTLRFGDRLNAVEWVHGRPATSVQGDPRIGHPGHKDREGGESQFEQDAVRIELHEAAILQGFRPDYPFQGTKTSQFRQCGNAVPPTWAAQIIRTLSRSA